MRFKLIVCVILLLAGCTNNKTLISTATQATSINKIWHFKNLGTSSTPNRKSAAWIGENILDLTNKDTLQFSYGNTHNKPTAYLYKILHDTIFIQNKPGYKILKLTDTEMDLMPIFKNSGEQNAGKHSVVMIYRSK